MARPTLPPGFLPPPGTKIVGINLDALRLPATRTIPPLGQPAPTPVVADGKPTKYRNVRTAYDGRTYDSKAEARRAEELDGLKAAGTILDWFPQVLVRLDSLTYRVDFLIISGAGSWFDDVKGVETQRTRDLLKLWRDHARLPLHLRFRDRTEIILPRGTPAP